MSSGFLCIIVLMSFVCGAALALDDVAREGPGRPDEAKDCGTISHFCPQESEGLSHKLDLHERRHTRNDVGIAAPHRTSRQNDDAPGLYLFKVYVVELVHLVGVGEGLINQRGLCCRLSPSRRRMQEEASRCR